MNIHLTAIDLDQHRIETWNISVPIENISYLEDVKWRGLENNYTRVYLKDGKSIVVTSSIQHIEELMEAIRVVAEPLRRIIRE